jgi:hypothetical protein
MWGSFKMPRLKVSDRRIVQQTLSLVGMFFGTAAPDACHSTIRSAHRFHGDHTRDLFLQRSPRILNPAYRKQAAINSSLQCGFETAGRLIAVLNFRYWSLSGVMDIVSSVYQHRKNNSRATAKSSSRADKATPIVRPTASCISCRFEAAEHKDVDFAIEYQPAPQNKPAALAQNRLSAS